MQSPWAALGKTRGTWSFPSLSHFILFVSNSWMVTPSAQNWVRVKVSYLKADNLSSKMSARLLAFLCLLRKPASYVCTTLAARMHYGVAGSNELRSGKYFLILTGLYRCIQTSTCVLPGLMNRTVGESMVHFCCWWSPWVSTVRLH